MTTGLIRCCPYFRTLGYVARSNFNHRPFSDGDNNSCYFIKHEREMISMGTPEN
jgi:hypothetical protein